MVGTISTYESGVDLVVEWKIQDFINLSESDGAWYCSTVFTFGGEEWYFIILPNGSSRNDSSGHVDLKLCKFVSGRSIKLSLSLCLKTVTGEKYNKQHGSKDFDDDDEAHYLNRFIPRSELSRKISELAPDGTLTVICTMKSSTSAGRDSNSEICTSDSDSDSTESECSSDSDSGECCHCKGNFAAGSLSCHQRMCMHRSIKCPDCFKVVVLQKWLDEHECQQERPEGATATAECPHCKLTLEGANMPIHEQSCKDRPMKCPQCGEDIATNLWLNHKCLTARTNAIGNLLHDLKRIMVCGDHSDVTVSVRGEEFRLHRNILGARNPFFGSRFNNESQEPTPGTLSIDNCDPDEFRTLIHYIYTGTADNLCPENVCGLYAVAVAYQEQQMRVECLQLMMNTLSVDNFCDYIALALKHDLEELLQKANKLFVRKTKEIIRHVKWKSFLEKYPEQANELYIKALDKDGEK